MPHERSPVLGEIIGAAVVPALNTAAVSPAASDQLEFQNEVSAHHVGVFVSSCAALPESEAPRTSIKDEG